MSKFRRSLFPNTMEDLIANISLPWVNSITLTNIINRMDQTAVMRLMEEIASNPSITGLIFRNIQLPAENSRLDCSQIFNYLSNTITSLEIQDSLSDDEAISLANLLMVSTTLREVKFSKIHLTKNGLIALGNALAINKHLRSIEFDLFSEDLTGALSIAEALRVNKTLENFSLSCRPNDRVIATIRQALLENNTLKRLNLAIDSSQSGMLADIILSNSSLTHIGMTRSLGRAESVVISTALAYNRYIESIDTDFHYSRFEKEGIESLMEAGTGVKCWSFYGIHSSEGIQAIAEKLQHNNAIVDIKISSYGDSYNPFAPIVRSIHNNITLKRLFISSLDTESCNAMADLLRVNTTLTNLHLGFVEEEGAMAIAEGLKCNTTLQELSLSSVEKGIEEIAKAMILNKGVETLNLDITYLYAENLLSALEEVLRRNNTLKGLFFDDIFASHIPDVIQDRLFRALLSSDSRLTILQENFLNNAQRITLRENVVNKLVDEMQGMASSRIREVEVGGNNGVYR